MIKDLLEVFLVRQSSLGGIGIMMKSFKKLLRLIKHKKFKEVMIIYVLINLGVLFTIYGCVLYSPALLPDAEDLTPEGAKMEIMNLTKGAFISQDFGISQYNIGFDMLNIGGIFLVVGLLFYNYLENSNTKKLIKKPTLKIYQLHKKGHLQGNIIEWSCLVVFLFAFFTFLSNMFVYIIILSFIVGVIGFTIRKLNSTVLLQNMS